MNKKTIIIIVIIIIVLAILLLLYNSFEQKNNQQEFVPADEEGNSQLANPAVVFCEEIGGENFNINLPEGEKDYCALPDGRKCERWGFYRSNGEECDELTADDYNEEENRDLILE